ncbi:hypothetical protein HMPREF0185_03542 [Brevundimonas diminuta 470-4]|nr:hypothetical protein HMPREF0185_03542 [Brevundimonas diminuta 470-4]
MVFCDLRCVAPGPRGQPPGLSTHGACPPSPPALRTKETAIFIRW